MNELFNLLLSRRGRAGRLLGLPLIMAAVGLALFAGRSLAQTTSAPGNLAASASQGIVALQWQPASTGTFSNPTGYQIFRASSAQGPFQQVGVLSLPEGPASAGSLSYEDQPGSGTWYYEVEAFNINPSTESPAGGPATVVVPTGAIAKAVEPLASTNTFTKTPTSTTTKTDTPTITSTSTKTFTPTITPTPTKTPTITPTSTKTFTPTITPTPTKTYTPTPTFTNTFTPTPTPTFTPTSTFTSSYTPTPTFTNTFTPTRTFTNTLTPTITPTYTPSCCQLLLNLPTPSGGFNGPGGMAADYGRHLVFVADGTGRIVSYSTQNFVLLTTLGSNGSGQGQFSDPDDVALGPDGDLYVAEYGNQRVQKITESGGFLGYIGSGVIGNAKGVFVDPGGGVYITSQSGTVYRFDPTGPNANTYNLTVTFGGSYLNAPTGILKTGSGSPATVYVSDSGNNHVLAFVETSGGSPITYGYSSPTTILASGTSPGQVELPRDLVTDLAGNFYVADATGGRIQAFNPTWDFMWQCQPSNNPWGVRVNEYGNVLAGLQTDNTVEVLEGCVTEPTLTPSPTLTPLSTYTSTPTLTFTSTPTPYPTLCYNPAVSFTSPNTNFINGSAVDGAGNLYLTQDGVMVFNSAGATLNEFGTVELGYPAGIAVNGQAGLVYVADQISSWIDVFTTQGKFQNAFYTLPNGTQMNEPSGVALDANGNVYVADSGDNQIAVFNPSGAPQTVFGSGVLNDPEGVAVDSNGNIYVGEAGAAQVTKFNSSYQKQFSFYGNGLVDEPDEMKVDSEGLLWVADPDTGLITVYDSGGNLLAVLDGTDIGGSAFGSPLVSVTSSGTLYVPDVFADTIQEFSPCSPLSTPTATPTPTLTPTSTLSGTPTATSTPTPTPLVPQVCLQFSGSFDSPDGNFVNGSALDGNGNLYLSQDDVVAFNSQGATINEFGGATIVFPEGLVYNGATNQVFVVDNGAGQVDIFGLNGTLAGVFSSLSGGVSLNDPAGIAVDSNTACDGVAGPCVYVGDSGNNQVDQFASNGTYVTSIGSGILDDPEGVAVDGNGNIYVGEAGAAQVTKFNSSYQKQFSFDGQGLLEDPYELKVDSNNNVWVADQGAGLVVAFNSSGEVLGDFDGTNIGGTAFSAPLVSVNPSGTVYSADTFTRQIQVFTPCGPNPTPTATFSPTLTPTPTLSPTLTPTITATFTVTDTPLASQACLYYSTSFTSPNSNVINGSAVDGNGDLYLTQNGVMVLNSLGVSINSFGSAQLAWPAGIAVSMGSSVTQVYVADQVENAVAIFNAAGSLTGWLDTLSDGSAFSSPTGVALDSAGNVYVADSGNGRVAKFNASATPVAIYGQGVLSNPEGVAVDSNGDIYVGDSDNSRVAKFNASGAFQFGFNGNGLLGEPYEMKEGSNNLLWVADPENSQVLVFDADGDLVGDFTGSNVPGAEAFDEVLVSVASNGTVWVPDSYSQVVQEFVSCAYSPTPTPTNTPTGTPTPSATPTRTATQTATSTPTSTFAPGTCLQFITDFVGITSPNGEAMDSSGNIYISQPSANQVVVYNPEGALLRSFSTGSGTQPMGMVFGNDGNLYVVESGVSQVGMFNTFGVLYNTFGASQLVSPQRIAVDASGDFYVTDATNGNVYEYAPARNYLRAIGGGGLVKPNGVAVDSSGNVYVAQDGTSGQTGNNSVQVFNSSATPTADFGGLGTQPGQFNNPQELKYDAYGHLWVVDSGNNRVQVLTSSGVTVYAFGVTGTGQGQFSSPMGIVLDSAGDAYVSDKGNNQIQLWSPCGAASTPTPLYTYSPTPTFTSTPPSPPTPCSNNPNVLSWSGDLVYAAGLAVDTRHNNVYVADDYGGAYTRISEYTSSGGLVNRWGNVAGETTLFGNIAQMTFDNKAEELYVVDSGDNVVDVFEPDGVLKRSFGNGGSSAANLASPYGIALDGQGNVFVADGNNDRVQEYATAGQFEKTIGAGSQGAIETWNDPTGVAIGPDGNLYVMASSVIAVFNPSNGAFLWQFSVSASGGARSIEFDGLGRLWQVDYPGNNNPDCYVWSTQGVLLGQPGLSAYQIGFDAYGNFYGANNGGVDKYALCGPTVTPTPTPASTVCVNLENDFPDPGSGIDGLVMDNSRNHLYATDANGTSVEEINAANDQLIRRWPTGGTGAGLVYDPKAQELYVVDQANKQVLVFAQDGVFLRSFGSSGSMPGEFNSPQEPALDGLGNIFIADSGNNCVVEYSTAGTFEKTIGHPGTSLGAFQSPTGVAIGLDGNLYVVDATGETYRVTVFNPTSGTALRAFNSYSGGPYLTVDPSGRLWSTSGGNNVAYDMSGNYLGQFGSFSSEPQLAIDSMGNLYNGGGTIFKFALCGYASPTFTPTPTGTFYTPTLTPSISPTRTYTFSPTPTYSPTGSPTLTPTSTVTAAVTTCESFAQSVSIGRYSGPQGVEVDPKSGRIFAAGTGSQISVFSQNMGFLTSFGSSAAGPGKFSGPAWMTLDKVNEWLYINGGTNVILVYDLSGNYLRALGNGFISHLIGIALDATSQNVYATDSNGNDVVKFTPGGKFEASFGNSGPGQLYYPQGIAVGPDGNVYVADYGHDQVSVFTPSGSYLRSWTPPSPGFSNPYQMRFDNQGLLWIVDYGNNLLRVFNAAGAQVASYGGSGSGNGLFNGPLGFAFNTDGGFFVADSGNGLLQRFAPCVPVTPTPTPSVTLPPTPCETAPAAWITSSNGPLALAAYEDGNPSGKYFVLNLSASYPHGPLVSIYSAGLSLIGQFGLGYYPPLLTGQLADPTAILVDPVALEVYVVDYNGYSGQGRVDVYDFNGVFKRQVGNGLLSQPYDAALDGLGNLYVADKGNNRVAKFTTAGQFEQSIGSNGSLPGQLTAPQGIAVGPDGNIYVGETYPNQRISAFSPSGAFVRMFGGPGSGNGQFGNGITSLQFDAGGLLWVSDSQNYRVQVLDRYGDFLESIGTNGSGLGQFGYPFAALPAYDGGLYVADASNNRIQRFYNCGPTITPTPTATPTPAATPFSGGFNLLLDGGSGNYSDNSGNLWLADQAYASGGFGYVTGEGGTQATSSLPVSGTANPGLYQTYRYGSTLGFEFTLPAGAYQVTLKFADFISTGRGQNVMNVASQGLTVVQGLDVYGTVGPDTALDRTFRVNAVSGTPLGVTLTASTGQAFLSAVEVTALQQGNGMQIFLSEPGGGALAP